MKLLIIEDKKTLSDLLAHFLGQKFETTTKENGFEALSWMQQSNIPDLIITDLEMPKMGGLEFIKKIKESGYFSEIPIIVLSCRDSSKDRIESLKAGASDYIVKPFNPEELLIRIENILGKVTNNS
ncbi:MAG: response regulator transcription factor [Cellulophaga sp.]|nr:response regulator transcription factor [Cellulophaga sp.]